MLPSHSFKIAAPSRRSRRSWLAPAIPLLLLFSTSAATGQSAAKVRAILQSNYRKIDEAASKKDARTITSLRTSSFLLIPEKGKRLDRTQSAMALRNQFRAVESAKPTTTIDSLVVKAGEAKVRLKEHVELVLRRPGGAKANLVLDMKSEDLWTKTPKGWLIKQSKNLSSAETLNGNRIEIVKKKPAKAR